MSQSPIVVGTDGSFDGTRAVEWAARDAAGRGLPLRIVHVERPPEFRPPAPVGPGAGERGRIILREALGHARRAGAEASADHLYGEPAPTLLACAGANGLVVSARGLGRESSLPLGSTPLRLAAASPGPLVAVRGGSAGPHGEILLGLDPEDPGPEPLRYAFETAAAHGARLRVVHAWDCSDSFDSHAAGRRLGAIELAAVFDRVVTPWRLRFPQVKTVEEVVVEHPAAALIEASTSADLIVLGGRPGLPGPVTLAALQYANCPVAFVPTPIRELEPATYRGGSVLGVL